MSVYIKGMEMPGKGEYRMTLYVCDDGYAYMDVDLFPVDKDRFEAVPVPPHGDLIDAQEEMRLMQSCDYDTYDDYSRAFDMLDNAPTIIEAEEVDNG